MLKINLLPESVRKYSISPIEQFHRTPLMWVVVGLMIGIVVLLLLPIAVHGQQLHALNAKVAALQPKKHEVDELQQSLQQLRAEQEAFQGLGKGQGHWAKRLNSLSTLTPEGVWFTDLTLELSTGLVLRGSAIGQGDTEMVGIGRFVQDLKSNAEFSSVFKNIQIESIKRTQDRTIEVIQFTITASLEKAPKP